MVLQDAVLFGGTIMDNIRYGRLDATDAEVIAAAEATFVDRFVRTLPEGYDTAIEEEGANISAGERQLITIARAFLADPALLILDEATSSVDTRTEVLVQEAMAALRTDRTSFVIAHRLSTIRDADVILVMEHGDIVEQGSHEQLLEAEGAYHRLYWSQFASGVDPDEDEAVLERSLSVTGEITAVAGAGAQASRRRPDVLLLGGGITGLALAHELAPAHDVTALEAAPGPRGGGYMIDFFGPGFVAAERMGLLEELRSRGHVFEGVRYAAPDGTETGRIDVGPLVAAAGGRYFSILRPEVELGLLAALPASVQLRYGARVEAVRDAGLE